MTSLSWYQETDQLFRQTVLKWPIDIKSNSYILSRVGIVRQIEKMPKFSGIVSSGDDTECTQNMVS